MPNLTSLYLTVYNFINIPTQLSGKLLAKMHLDKRLHKKKNYKPILFEVTLLTLYQFGVEPRSIP